MMGMLALNEVLSCSESLSYSQSLLVLPFLFHKETVEYLVSAGEQNIDDFVKRKSRLLANLNQRYYSLLPITVNSILLGKSLENFDVASDNITSLHQINTSYDFGRRHKLFRKASPAFVSIITSDKSDVIYSKLKISI